jgi:hypothetical protein
MTVLGSRWACREASTIVSGNPPAVLFVDDSGGRYVWRAGCYIWEGG